MQDTFVLAGKEFNSRLIIGTGKYRSFDEMKAAHRASGAEMVTVAVNRVPLDRKSESFLDHLDPRMQILPNTAGCYDADHAIRTARLAREALGTEWIKLEVIGDQVTLLPDNEQTLEAAKVLVKEGFVVLPARPQAQHQGAREAAGEGQDQGQVVRHSGGILVGSSGAPHVSCWTYCPWVILAPGLAGAAGARPRSLSSRAAADRARVARARGSPPADGAD